MVQKLEIAIAGCGIGGLAVAALLQGFGHSVTVYDQFGSPAPVGSGLVIQPVGQAVLKAVGALKQAGQAGVPIRHLCGNRAPDDRLVLDANYGKRAGLAIHRASLFAALFEQAQAAGMDLHAKSKVISSLLRAGERYLVLQSGVTEGPFDLVIDATGARSLLSPIQNHVLPFGALWANVDWPSNTELPVDTLSQKYRTSSIMAGVLPIGQMPGNPVQKAAIFWSLPHHGYKAWLDRPLTEWRAKTIDHWPEFAPFVMQINDRKDITFASYTHGVLSNPVGNRLVHIGDAAHTASPQLGQGANMALLDAYALAACLGKHSLDQALEVYRASRRNHTRIYQAISRVFTPLYQSENRVLPVIRDRILAPVMRIPMTQHLLTRLICGDIVPPVQAGLPALNLDDLPNL